MPLRPRLACTVITLGALAALQAQPARADQHELSISVRPTYGVARIGETGTAEHALVRGRGVVGGVGLGVRNWLDLGVEVLSDSFDEASYQMAKLPIGGTPFTGPLRRISERAQLRALVTFRTGAAWVPFVQLGLGGGARHRTTALIMVATAQGERWIVPDDQHEEITIDLAAGVRAGIERRLATRWIVGVSAAASHSLGMFRPDLQTAELTLSLAYRWYLALGSRTLPR